MCAADGRAWKAATLAAGDEAAKGPAARLAAVRPGLPVDLHGAILAESWSNDAWITRQAVLRVCWRGDRGRLLREQALLAALPAAIPHAEVLGAGRAGDLTWMALRRIEGQRLDLAWPALTSGQQHEAVSRLGAALAALHRWTPPPAVRELLRQPATLAPVTREVVAGSAIVPLPFPRLAPLLDWTDQLPGMDVSLARRVRDRLARLRPVLSDQELAGGPVVHGDAHLANVLWHRGRLTALLDFEWARTGPPDLELEAICRDDPYLASHAGPEPCAAADVPVLAGLRPAIPACSSAST